MCAQPTRAYHQRHGRACAPACCPGLVVGSTPGGGCSRCFATVPRWSAARAARLSTLAALWRRVGALITGGRRGGGVPRDSSMDLPKRGAARP